MEKRDRSLGIPSSRNISIKPQPAATVTVPMSFMTSRSKNTDLALLTARRSKLAINLDAGETLVSVARTFALKATFDAGHKLIL
jgi:hypothetical protein